MSTIKYAITFILLLAGLSASGLAFAAAEAISGIPNCNTVPDTMKYSLDYWTLPGDKSIQYLGIIFGQVGTTLFGEGNDLMGRVFEILNTAIITLATLLLTYSTLVGIMSTANEGEAMGKKWSSAWIPARSAAGIGLLIPGLSGYSMIQVIIMTIIIQGVGAGNAMWRMVANEAMRGISIHTSSSNMTSTNFAANLAASTGATVLGGVSSGASAAAPYTPFGAGDVVSLGAGAAANAIPKSVASIYDGKVDELLENLFKGVVCQQILKRAAQDFGGYQSKPKNAPANSPNIPLLNIPQDITSYIIPEQNKFAIGSPSGTPALKEICGSATVISSPEAKMKGNDKEAELRLVALSQIADMMVPAADEVATACYEDGARAIDDQSCRDKFSNKGFMLTARSKYLGLIDTAAKANLLETDSTTISNSGDQVFCNALKDGWLFAGSYYYKIVAPPKSKQANTLPVTPDTFTIEDPGPSNKNTALLNSVDLMYSTNSTSRGCSTGVCCTGVCQNYTSRFTKLVPDYITWSKEGAGGQASPKVLSLEPSGSFPPPFNKIWSKSIGLIPNAIVEMLEKQLTQSTFDPLVSMQKMGSDILMIIEIAYVAGVIITFALAIPASIGYGTQPGGMMYRSVLTWILPLAMAMVSVVWAGAATLAIYLPLVPYIVFTMAALSWLIICIEAVVAGPIVALGFMSPSGDHWGKATPAINILANIFLRPALMIVGFIAAARVFVAVIGMLNYGFAASIKAAVPAMGLFGPIAVLVFYAGIVITITHKCFSLIYVIPDKALSWIGGQAEQSGVSQDTQAVGDSASKGIDAGAKAAEGAGKQATATFEAARDKGKAKNEAAAAKGNTSGKGP